MKKIDVLFLEYGESHQNETNKAIHWVCVPPIFFSLVALIASIPTESLQRFMGRGWFSNWATVILVLVIIYYGLLSVPLAIGMLLFGMFCLFLINLIMSLQIAPLWL